MKFVADAAHLPKQLVPHTVIEDWAVQAAVHPQDETPLQTDFVRINEAIFTGATPVRSDVHARYTATAGAPCSGKTWTLAAEMRRNPADSTRIPC